MKNLKDKLSAWDTAAKYGCDMSLLEDNLRKTPAERIKTHQHALNTAIMLRKALVLQLNAIKEKYKETS